MKRISNDFKFLFNGKQPDFIIEYGFDGLNNPWFKCYLDGKIDDIEQRIEGIAEIEGTNIRANVTMIPSIEFSIDSIVIITYRTIDDDRTT